MKASESWSWLFKQGVDIAVTDVVVFIVDAVKAIVGAVDDVVVVVAAVVVVVAHKKWRSLYRLNLNPFIFNDQCLI